MLQARFRSILSPRSEPGSPATDGCADESDLEQQDLGVDRPGERAAAVAAALAATAGPDRSAAGGQEVGGASVELRAALSVAEATIVGLRARERELERELEEAQAPGGRSDACAAPPAHVLAHTMVH